MAGLDSRLIASPPWLSKLYEPALDQKKASVQVLPLSEAGMSKLNSDEVVLLIVAEYCVPNAVFGDDDETGTIR